MIIACAGSLLLWAQSPGGHTLTAREIFYSGTKKSPAPPVKPKGAAPPAVAKSAEPAAPVEPAGPPGPPLVKPEVEPEKPVVPSVQVSNPAPAPARPQPPARSGVKPAIRYSVLKMDAAGNPVEVDPDSVFRNGDQIQLSVEVNTPGFLYIVHRGSSGAWEVLFPSPDIAGGENAVQPGVRYQLPSPDDVLTMSGQPGEERLVPVFSKARVKDLEELIYSVQASPSRKQVDQAPPARTMVAVNNIKIDDGLLNQLQLASRDLIVEKAAKSKPSVAAAQPADLAFYAASNSDDPAARVVVNLLLDHR